MLLLEAGLYSYFALEHFTALADARATRRFLISQGISFPQCGHFFFEEEPEGLGLTGFGYACRITTSTCWSIRTSSFFWLAFRAKLPAARSAAIQAVISSRRRSISLTIISSLHGWLASHTRSPQLASNCARSAVLSGSLGFLLSSVFAC